MYNKDSTEFNNNKNNKEVPSLDSLMNLGYITVIENKDDNSPQFKYYFLKNTEDSTKHFTIPTNEWSKTKSNILKEYSNNAYPFAAINFQEIIPKNDTLYILYHITPGPHSLIDTIIIEGNLKVEQTFLEKLVKIKTGDAYNEEKILSAERRLRQAPFIQYKEDSYMQFTIAKNEWHLPLDKRKTNTIEGILGVQTDPQLETGVRITADVDLDLMNILGYGESLSLNYKNLETQSPRLFIAADLPYLAGLDIGPEINFALNFKDTSYSEQQLRVGLRYYFDYFTYLRMGYYNERSSVITPDLKGFDQLTDIPDINNFKSNGFYIGVNFNREDNLWAATKGWSIEAEAQFLKKIITPHHSYLDEADRLFIPMRDWYKNHEEHPYIWQAVLIAKHYIPVYKSFIVHYKIDAAHKQIPTASLNELYRIGGQQRLRGFNELLFYTKSYGILSLEPRLLFSGNSYVFLFADLAYLNRKQLNNFEDQYAIGLGAGLSLFTNTGIFNIALGTGKEYKNPFDFKRIQVHIGYKAIF